MHSLINVTGTERLSPQTVHLAEDLKTFVMNDLASWPELKTFGLDELQRTHDLGSTLVASITAHDGLKQTV